MMKHKSEGVENKYKLPISREDLYKQVWAEPMTALAVKYQVSSSYLARVCCRMNVPRPERGYWAKLAVGKKVYKPPLPELTPEYEQEWVRFGEDSKIKRVLPKAPKKKPKRQVGPVSNSRHHLIRDARPLFLKGRETENGYLRPNKRLLVDILLSKSSLDLGLEIMNKILLAIEAYGYRINFAPTHEVFYRSAVDERRKPQENKSYINQWAPARCTIAYVGTLAIGMTLYEMSEQVEMIYLKGEYIPVASMTDAQKRQAKHSHTWTTTQDKPSGQFCLQLYSPYPGTEWVKKVLLSGKKEMTYQARKIAKSLSNYASEIEVLVEEAERRAEVERIRWQEQKEKWRIEEEQRKQIKALDESQSELMLMIERWAEEKRINLFFDEIEQALQEVDQDHQKELTARLALAKQFISKGSALELLANWKTPEERLNTI